MRLEELAGDPWVQPTSGCAALVVEACAAAGFTPRTVFESDDYGAIQGFVAAGAGVALVPELALANRRDVVAARLAPPAPARRVLAVRRPGAPPPHRPSWSACARSPAGDGPPPAGGKAVRTS